jgi:very-short-patch-repair endonuclease
MKPVVWRELRSRFRAQHALITRAEARGLGVTARQEGALVATGEWERLAGGVIRLAGSPRTPEQDLLAACLAGGPTAVASHQSAAWLWELGPVPDRHAITIARTATSGARLVEVHRPRDYPAHALVRRGIPCTNPLRALVDLAAVWPPPELDDAVDQALARKVVTVAGIEAEVGRLSQRGRLGAGRMREALHRRGLIGAPHPSVLESRALRLLRQHGIVPMGVEVRAGPDGRYRVDILLVPGVVMELDGFAYHSDPEQMAEDKRRRTRIRLEGTVVLEYTWRDIVYDQRRVMAEVLQVLWKATAS